MAWSWLKQVGKVGLAVGEVLPVAGQILAIAKPIVAVVKPAASPALATVSVDLDTLAGIIFTVEGVSHAIASPLPGADKAKAAGPLIAQVIAGSALVAGRKIENPAEWQAGAIDLAGGLARMLNAVAADVPEPPATPPTP
jgi:hypothetical protein